MTSDGGDLWRPEPPLDDPDGRPRRAPQAGPGVPADGDPRHTPPVGAVPQQPWTPQPPQPSQPPHSPQPPPVVPTPPRPEPRFDPQTGRPLTADPRAQPHRPRIDPHAAAPDAGPAAFREQHAGPQNPYRGREQYADPRHDGRRPDQPGAAPSNGPDPRRTRAQPPAGPDPRQAAAHGPGPNPAPAQPPAGDGRRTPPPSHGQRPIVDDNRALFRDEVPGRGDNQGGKPPSWQPPPPPEQHAAAQAEPPRERDWRDDYEDAVSATRWDLSPIPSMAVAPRRANPSNLEALIPPRRGRVQGPATRRPGGPAGTAPGTREGAPWEAGVRDRPATGTRPAPTTAEPSVGRASRLMALGTLASRVTGLVRQFLIVAAIGTAGIGNAYTIGLNLPNMLYILIIGGALNAVFVPQLVRSMHRDRDGGAAYASRLLTLVLTGVLVLTVVTELFTAQLVDLFSNFSGANRQLAIDLGRMFMPQIFFLGLFVVLGQVLNAKGRFGPMMWTPVLTNVVVIGSTGAYWYINRSNDLTPSTIPAADVRLLGLGVTLGIAVQA
ncbi:MAG: lipid II flippase MurJ, partial [Catenulispora sp.]